MNKILMILILIVSPAIAETVPVEVHQFIDSAMSGKVHSAGWGFIDYFLGLENGSKLSDLKAGDPIHVYRITADSVRKISADAPVMTYAKPMDVWYVPMLLHGKHVGQLIVFKPRGDPKWQIGGYGGGGISEAWEKVCKTWPKSSGYNPIYIEGPVSYYFFHVPEKGDSNLTDLFWKSMKGGRRSSTDTSYRILWSSRDVIKTIKKAIGPKRSNFGGGG